MPPTTKPLSAAKRFKMSSVRVTVDVPDPENTLPASGKIEQAADAARIIHVCMVKAGALLDRENFMLLSLNVRGKPVGFDVLSVGTLSASLVHPRELFVLAIQHRAATVIIAHNHPSGETGPSDEDYAMTDRLVQAGKLLGIPVIDSIVIGHDPSDFRSIPV